MALKKAASSHPAVGRMMAGLKSTGRSFRGRRKGVPQMMPIEIVIHRETLAQVHCDEKKQKTALRKDCWAGAWPDASIATRRYGRSGWYVP